MTFWSYHIISLYQILHELRFCNFAFFASAPSIWFPHFSRNVLCIFKTMQETHMLIIEAFILSGIPWYFSSTNVPPPSPLASLPGLIQTHPFVCSSSPSIVPPTGNTYNQKEYAECMRITFLYHYSDFLMCMYPFKYLPPGGGV